MTNKIANDVIDGLKQFLAELENDDLHCWRRPRGDEPMEVGGVCIKCGGYTNDPDGSQPCRPEA